MPDGTAVLFVETENGFTLATQGKRLPDGKLPRPSGLGFFGCGPDAVRAVWHLVMTEEELSHAHE